MTHIFGCIVLALPLVNSPGRVNNVIGLLYSLGNLKEALEYAMAHSLWGHALFLSSKMGKRLHEHVMSRFTKTNISSADPLQTVYELLSNRQPAVYYVSKSHPSHSKPHPSH